MLCEHHPETAWLAEASSAAAHDFALTNELSVKFAAVQGKKDVEVDACICVSTQTQKFQLMNESSNIR